MNKSLLSRYIEVKGNIKDLNFHNLESRDNERGGAKSKTNKRRWLLMIGREHVSTLGKEYILIVPSNTLIIVLLLATQHMALCYISK